MQKFNSASDTATVCFFSSSQMIHIQISSGFYQARKRWSVSKVPWTSRCPLLVHNKDALPVESGPARMISMHLLVFEQAVLFWPIWCGTAVVHCAKGAYLAVLCASGKQSRDTSRKLRLLSTELSSTERADGVYETGMVRVFVNRYAPE